MHMSASIYPKGYVRASLRLILDLYQQESTARVFSGYYLSSLGRAVEY
jgi:hypothetical protein